MKSWREYSGSVYKWNTTGDRALSVHNSENETTVEIAKRLEADAALRATRKLRNKGVTSAGPPDAHIRDDL